MHLRMIISFVLSAFVSAASNTFLPNNTNIYYSPYAWNVEPTQAATINSAAYIKFLFSGSFLNFRFNVSRMATPASEVYWRVDNGPMTPSLVLDTVSVTIPPNNTKMPYHSVELLVKSTTERAQRWAATEHTKTCTRIILTAIETDGKLAPWVPLDVNILVYGDSITEGVLTLGGSEHFDTDHNDASVVYSHALGRLLGAEVGVIGFGATGVTVHGSGQVPALTTTWNQLWDGVPRKFDPKPDLIVMNEGTNDGCDTTNPGCVGKDITADLITVLKDLLAACPGTPIAVLEPFNLGQTKHLQAAVKGAESALVHYVETTGFYSLAYGGSLHPTGANDVAQIAPRIANKLRPLLARSLLLREGLM